MSVTESTANFLVNCRMNKQQQMRRSHRGGDLLLQVRSYRRHRGPDGTLDKLATDWKLWSLVLPWLVRWCTRQTPGRDGPKVQAAMR
jgi:hypothetical protein